MGGNDVAHRLGHALVAQIEFILGKGLFVLVELC